METPDQEDPEKAQAHDLDAQEDPSSGSLSEEEAEEVGVQQWVYKLVLFFSSILFLV
jgi:hypothetical protein